MLPILITLQLMLWLWRAFRARFFAVSSFRFPQHADSILPLHNLCFLPRQHQRLHSPDKWCAPHNQAFCPAGFPPGLRSRQRFAQARLQILLHRSQIVCAEPPALLQPLGSSIQLKNAPQNRSEA